MKQRFNIEIDLSRDDLFDAHGLARLRAGYMMAGETSPQERFRFIADQFGSNQAHAQRMYDYMSLGIWSNSTPVLAYGRNAKGLPISCFLVHVEDTTEGLLRASNESRVMTIGGGGVGLYFGMRETGSKSTGPIAHAKTYDADTSAYKQAQTRRGAFAIYLDVNHPQIMQHIDIRNPTGGDANQKALNIHNAVNLSDDFMNRVYQLSRARTTPLTQEEHDALDAWPLITPEDGKTVVGIGSVKQIWQRMHDNRQQIGGEPFFHFTGNSNAALPQYQKDLGINIYQSNLCTEIMLGTGTDNSGNMRSAVCCLGSINFSKLDLIDKDEETLKLFMSDVMEFLDNVLQTFIDSATGRPGYESAVYSATRERAIGIGMLGWHDYLQQKNIPFASAIAAGLNKDIWERLNRIAMEVNKEMAITKGACPDSANSATPVRFSHVFAIAPNATSSIIMSTSPSQECYRSNYYIASGDLGVFPVKNRNLEKVLQSLGKDTPDVWNEIAENEGSVSTLDFLSDWQKEVFATSMEVSPEWVIQHAADRQPWICQGQSTNVFARRNATVADLGMITLLSWKMGLKSLYYLRSNAASRGSIAGTGEKYNPSNKAADLERMFQSLDQDGSACVACE